MVNIAGVHPENNNNMMDDGADDNTQNSYENDDNAARKESTIDSLDYNDDHEAYYANEPEPHEIPGVEDNHDDESGDEDDGENKKDEDDSVNEVGSQEPMEKDNMNA